MEQQSTGRPYDTGDLRERLAKLERDHHHESRWLREEMGTVKLRLMDLEREGRLPSINASTKLLLALLLPLLVYLLTGSIEKAFTAARFVGDGG